MPEEDRIKVMSTDLYDLPEAYEFAFEAPDPDELARRLDEIREETATQALWLARAVKNCEANSAKLSAHGSAVDQKCGRLETEMSRIKGFILSRLEGHGIPKVKDALVSVSVQDSPPHCDIISEADVPDRFKRGTLTLPLELWPEGLREKVKVEVMRQAIIAAVKETGEVIPGTNVVRGKHTVIR
jgi:hypothetical protein